MTLPFLAEAVIAVLWQPVIPATCTVCLRDTDLLRQFDVIATLKWK